MSRPTLPVGANLSRHERETIIRISGDESEWDIYTSCPVMARKLEKLAEAHGVTPRFTQGGMALKLAKRAVSFRKPRVVTAKMREHLSAMARSRAENVPTNGVSPD